MCRIEDGGVGVLFNVKRELVNGRTRMRAEGINIRDSTSTGSEMV